MAKVKEEVLVSEVTVDLRLVLDRLEALEKAVAALTPAPPVRELKSEAQLSADDVTLALDGPSEPIPSNYRGVVDQALNKDFGIHLKSTGPQVRLTILVPKKYTSLNEEQLRMMKFDMRPRMIDNAEGENGVKLWADRVFSSFNSAIQSLIVNDRITNP